MLQLQEALTVERRCETANRHETSTVKKVGFPFDPFAGAMTASRHPSSLSPS
jgi:hypothetical protein